MRIILWVFLCISVFSCKRKQETLIDKAPLNEHLEAQHHLLRFSIEYPVNELEDWLNRKFEGTIIDKMVPKGKDSIQIIGRKTGRIKLYMRGDSVDVRFPLDLEINSSKERRSGKIRKRKLDGAVEFYLNIKPDVDKDWNIIAKSILKDYKWVKVPKYRIGGIQIGIKFIADYLLKNEVNRLTEGIDMALAEKVDLRKGLNRTWAKIQTPMPLIKSDSLSLFLKLDPREVTGDIKMNKKGFVFDMAVKTRALVHSHADSINQILPLPAFNKLSNTPEDSNRLEIITKIPLSYINYEVSEIIKNYKYENILMEVVIDDMHVQGSGRNVVLDLSISGTTQGKITLKGKPFYNKDEKALFIKDLDYVLETDHVVVNLLDKRLKEDLIRFVSDKVILDLGKQIDSLPDYLNESINQGRSKDKFYLNFKDIEIEDIEYLINQTDLEILMKFKPKFDLSLKKLPVRRKLRIR